MPHNEELTQTQILKHYLLGKKENAYLLDDNNNSKTIMLSGAWGSGKTHFWQKQIEPLLKEKQIAIYVSLYGKESINEIKFDIFKEAYNSQIKEDIISKSASLFHSVAPSFGEKSITEGFEKLNTKAKTKKATELLQQGSIVCFDDFERKSEKINLNDLFGFISQLSIDLNCKTVIILNSEVFKGKEAEIFSNVKEKTISKFFHFNPTIEELFTSISSDAKYDAINDYKSDILSVIQETEELNARIYTQVLDNCLEWLVVKKHIDSNIIRVLVLTTFNFILNHIILARPKFFPTGYKEDYNIVYTQFNFPDKRLYKIFPSRGDTTFPLLKEELLGRKEAAFMRRYPNDTALSLANKIIIRLSETKNDNYIFSDSQQTSLINWLNRESSRLNALWKYGYLLYYIDDIDQNTYFKISQFVKTGILLP